MAEQNTSHRGEHLQATSGELETGREELQSIDQELLAVKHELRGITDELAHARADLNNLVISAGIDTLFLDMELRVRRFIPPLAHAFNLLPSDLGQPLAHLSGNLIDADLVTDAAQVLHELHPIQRELTTTAGQVFDVRVRPYRDAADKINGVVMTFVDITSVRHAEQALRASELLQHTLLNAIDEGACIIERLPLRSNGLRDYRYVAMNPAMQELFGIRDPTGDTVRAHLPAAAAEAWYDDYDRVLDAGRVMRVERALEPRGAVLHMLIAPVEGDKQRLVAVIRDVSAPTQREHALRDAQTRQDYLLAVTDRLFAGGDAHQALVAALRLLARFVGADEAGYFELDANEQTATPIGHYVDGEGPALSAVRLEDFSRQNQQALKAGRNIVIADVAELALGNADREAYQNAGARAAMWAPVNRAGKLVGLLTVSQRQARTWSESSMSIMGETAERVRAAVVRARDMDALIQSEARYRTLFERMDEGFCVVEMVHDEDGKAVDYRMIEVNPAYERHTGIANAVGHLATELVPRLEADWPQTLEHVARSGKSVRVQRRAKGLQRVFELFAFRIGMPAHRQVAVLFRDVTERIAAEDQRQLLVAELNHRVKNILATVQALATQSFADAGCEEEAAQFEQRLIALARAHEVLTREGWRSAEIGELVRDVLSAWHEEGSGKSRISIHGPTLRIRPEMALALALAMHELATNAGKYGALSCAQGWVDLRWTISDGGDAPHFELRWAEHGGPPVAAPSRTGFGTLLIRTGLAHSVGGAVDLRFEADGVICILRAPLQTLVDMP